MIWGQSFDPADIGTVGLLVLLEGALSVDNALILGVMASRVPPQWASRALAFGLAGAFTFRLIAVVAAGFLLRWPAIKILGAAYLFFLAARHFLLGKRPIRAIAPTGGSFWGAVIGIELTDMAFAVDNVLAAVALIGPPPLGSDPNKPHPKIWVVLAGGMMGIVLTRFSAAVCLKLLRRLPRLEHCAYLIVLLVALKLVFELNGMNFQGPANPPFWVFWVAMSICLLIGLIPKFSPEPDKVG